MFRGSLIIHYRSAHTGLTIHVMAFPVKWIRHVKFSICSGGMSVCLTP
ncbi:hypothetical protein EVA_10990 [gut metagenome]|uniref:Uncharacterized protein n=1 Tax=gut metagenome TaxID=749906 RepID=J9GM60_9ZZZZ